MHYFSLFKKWGEREKEERDRVGVTKRNRERKIERFNPMLDDYPNKNIIVCVTLVVWEWEGDGNVLERTLKNGS